MLIRGNKSELLDLPSETPDSDCKPPRALTLCTRRPFKLDRMLFENFHVAQAICVTGDGKNAFAHLFENVEDAFNNDRNRLMTVKAALKSTAPAAPCIDVNTHTTMVQPAAWIAGAVGKYGKMTAGTDPLPGAISTTFTINA